MSSEESCREIGIMHDSSFKKAYGFSRHYTLLSQVRLFDEGSSSTDQVCWDDAIRRRLETASQVPCPPSCHPWNQRTNSCEERHHHLRLLRNAEIWTCKAISCDSDLMQSLVVLIMDDSLTVFSLQKAHIIQSRVQRTVVVVVLLGLSVFSPTGRNCR